MLSMIATLQQTDPQLIGEIERLGSALWLLAIAAVVVGSLSLIAIGASFVMLRSATRLMNNLEKQMNRLGPRVEPLIDKVTALATDARDTSDAVRRRVTGLMDTVADINGSLRDAAHSAEVRVRDFSAVVDVVKGELEEALLDTAATARGIQATARALRGEPVARPLPFDGADPRPTSAQLPLLDDGDAEDSDSVRHAPAAAAGVAPQDEDGGDPR